MKDGNNGAKIGPGVKKQSKQVNIRPRYNSSPVGGVPLNRPLAQRADNVPMSTPTPISKPKVPGRNRSATYHRQASYNAGKISFFKETSIYIAKCGRIYLNERAWTSILFAVVIVLIISYVAGDNVFKQFSATRSGAFAIVLGCLWIGIFNSIRSICREREIIKREHRTGLRISSYVCAHFVFELIICFIQAILVTVVFISMRGTPSVFLVFSPILSFFIIFFLCIFSADILGMLISSIVKNETLAMTVMPFILIVQMVMCGIIFKLEGASEYIANITISKWAVTAVLVSSNVNSFGDAISDYKEDYLFTSGHLLQCFGVLILFIVIYLALSIVALSFVDRDKR